MVVGFDEKCDPKYQNCYQVHQDGDFSDKPHQISGVSRNKFSCPSVFARRIDKFIFFGDWVRRELSSENLEIYSSALAQQYFKQVVSSQQYFWNSIRIDFAF